MSRLASLRDTLIVIGDRKGDDLYNRIFVVSAFRRHHQPAAGAQEVRRTRRLCLFRQRRRRSRLARAR
jgi:hypothetical protein